MIRTERFTGASRSEECKKFKRTLERVAAQYGWVVVFTSYEHADYYLHPGDPNTHRQFVEITFEVYKPRTPHSKELFAAFTPRPPA